ncbi:uncharacterized protein LOC120277259 isoform X2 [Dioscorea cayenensis subsp. rotundata]|uniref:Uncharacterized protein LOC120277259 isoform X2 n=1 Tax=Dioscorea cayennensis subsp. rotundata TaxID=55577 RepID=A0AB40CN22_DIOCR|nr:uncharacterized protein LOC120277259 isoform X2 [Dioscorea cayenensis subsp. rotundata]
MGNEMGNRNVNGLQASEQDDVLASMETYKSMKASPVLNNTEGFIEKQDAEDIIENGTSKASATLNDGDHIIKGLTDDLAGGVEEDKTLISKESSICSMESDGGGGLKDQEQYEVEEITMNEQMKCSIIANNAEDQQMVTNCLEDNLLEQHDSEEGSRNESSEALIISIKEQDQKSENQIIASLHSVESDEKHTNAIPDEGSTNKSLETLIISGEEQDQISESQTVASEQVESDQKHANSIPDGSTNKSSDALIISNEEQDRKGENQTIASLHSLASDEKYTNSIFDEESMNESLEALIISSEEQERKSENETIASVHSLQKDENHTNSIPDEGSSNHFSEALIVSSKEHGQKCANQTIALVHSFESDEKHANYILNVPSASDEKDLTQKQILEEKDEETSVTIETSQIVSIDLEDNEEEVKTSNEGIPISNDAERETIKDETIERPTEADTSVPDLTFEVKESQKEVEEHNEAGEQQYLQSDIIENDCEQSQILESINSAYLNAIDSEIERLVFNTDLIAFDELANNKTEITPEDDVFEEIIQTVETIEVVGRNSNERDKLPSLVSEECNEIGEDASLAEISVGGLEGKIEDGGEGSQGNAESTELPETSKETTDGALEEQTIEAKEFEPSNSNQQDQLPSYALDECNELREDAPLDEISFGECESKDNSAYQLSDPWSRHDGIVFKDTEGKIEDTDAKQSTEEEISQQLNQKSNEGPNAQMFEELLTKISSREMAMVASSQPELHEEMNIQHAMATKKEFEQQHTALETELQANMKSLIASINVSGGALTDTLSVATQKENQKQWQDEIHASMGTMVGQQADVSLVDNYEMPHVFKGDLEESKNSKDAINESTQEKSNSDALANTTITEIQASELQTPKLAFQTSVHESEEELAGNSDAGRTKAAEFENNPSMDQEKTIKCDVFAICQDISKTGAETSYSVLQSYSEESDKHPLLYQKEMEESEVPKVGRSDSGKLRVPLLSLIKEEVHEVKPLEKEGSPLIKKTVEEVWRSPAKKSMAASPQAREKPKTRSSIFSNCMCCTTEVLN